MRNVSFNAIVIVYQFRSGREKKEWKWKSAKCIHQHNRYEHFDTVQREAHTERNSDEALNDSQKKKRLRAPFFRQLALNGNTQSPRLSAPKYPNRVEGAGGEMKELISIDRYAQMEMKSDTVRSVPFAEAQQIDINVQQWRITPPFHAVDGKTNVCISISFFFFGFDIREIRTQRNET